MPNERYSRQSFLGVNSQEVFEAVKVGVVGLGGGGSHIVQQLAHLGFKNYALFDDDIVELSNLNRLVGAKLQDAENQSLKVDVARRLILGLHPEASVEIFATRWQENPHELRDCDLVFGCVDGFKERQELEVCARRYLIPYIDIGLDVFPGPRMAGQIILSMPGYHCMSCLGFLTEENLAKEVGAYGVAGMRPQVVWANGVLASTAVGIAVDLLTGWSGKRGESVFLSYDANTGLVSEHPKKTYCQIDRCSHFGSVGDPVAKKL